MTGVVRLICQLQDKGVGLWIEGESLAYDGPLNALTVEDLEQIRAHKSEIIGFLRQVSDLEAVQPIELADRSQPLPLSYAQQRLWFLNQLDQAASAAYHIPAALRLEGILDRAALRATLNTIVARHEALRTSFISIDGQPRQQIGPVDIGFQLTEHDLSALGGTDREARVKELSEAEAAGPFDLASGPLIRGQLLQLGAEEHVLLVTMHHIVSDGWSMGVLIREVGALYEALCAGREAALPKLPIQYADYAAWQRHWLQVEALQEQLKYWKEELSSAPALLELPTDRVRPVAQSFRAERIGFVMEEGLSTRLKAMCRQEEVTLFMLLLAGWSVLLSRLSGQPEVVIGVPVANRQRMELEGLIGFFVNTLALRVKVNSAQSIRDLLQQVKRQTLQGYAHQEAPFEQVVEVLQPARSLGHSAVFQVMLVLQNTPQQELSLQGLKLQPQEPPVGAVKFDLELSLQEVGEELYGSVNYASDLFERATIERWIGYFKSVLEEMTESEEREVAALALIGAAERDRILEEFNATHVEYPEGELVHELFEAQVERTPDAVAVVFEGEQLSYAQLNARANQLARYLVCAGVQPDDRVAICVERGFEMIVGLLGILKAGGAYVPLDPQYPAERLAYMLQDSAPVVLLTRESMRETFNAYSTVLVSLDKQWSEIAKLDQSNIAAAELGLNSKHLAYVIYTSGSTGHPKGVMVEHGGLLNYLRWAMSSYRSEQGEGSVVASSFAFDATVTGLYCPLLSGQKVVLVKEGEELDGVERLLRTEQRWSLVKISPAHLSALGRRWQSTVRCEVEAFVIGGEALAVETAALWRDLAPQTRLINEYGPTETVVGCIAYEIDEGWEERRGVPIGRPIWNTQIYILDGYLQPVPIGVVGEIYIGGAGVARGYLNRADLTAERFIADPFGASGGRLYKSGDLGRYRADGNIEYVGRNDFQVKIRGYRIELGEIESKLSSCEGVREAVVLAREDIPGEKRLVAYVTAQTGEPLVVSALRERLSAELPEYLVPAAYVQLSSLPLTLNGKLDRKALPAPDEEAYSHQRYEAPQGEIEELLAGIWQELLGVERVGRNDNFFELGGHSLLAVRLTSRLRKEFGVEVSLRDLFAQPTLQGVGRLMTSATRSAQTSIELADRSQPLPLSYAQQRLWFLNQLDQAASAAYHIPAALRLEGILDRAALRATLNTIVARHEALRTSFISIDGQPRQQIGPVDIGFQLTEHDLSALGGTDREARVKELSEAEAAGPFDLASGPLIRGQLLQLGAEEHVLLVTMHHIVSDGWSMGVLIREVGALYEALCAGREAALPKLPIQYADYAAWQRHWLQVEALQEQLKYWKEELSSAPALLELPTDRVRPVAQSYKGDTVALSLTTELRAGLRRLSRRNGVTLFMTLLAGWSVLLSRLSGQPEVVIGVPVANRQRMELEGLIGFFVNTLALRVKVDDKVSVKDLFAQIRRTALSAYANQDIPFEQVVEALQPARSLSHSPVFQSILVLDNTLSMQLSLPRLKLRELEQKSITAKFDLELSLQEVGEELYGSVNYASDLFERATIERWIGYFKSVLEEMTESEEREVAALALIGAAERDRILEEFNATHVEYPEGELVHELFEAQVERTPDAVAVVFEGEQLSYAQLNARANQLARYLVCAGVQPDDRVAICVERGFEMIVGLLGILKAGGAYVPLDPQYPAERLAYMLQDSAPVVLLTRESMRETFNAYSTVLVSLDKQWSEIAKLDQSNIAAAELGLNSKHLAYVIYTSGSTGLPKGVAMQNESLVNLIQWQRANCGNRGPQRILQFAALGFDVLFQELSATLSEGGTLFLLREELRRDPNALAVFVSSNRLERLHLPCVALYALAEEVTQLNIDLPDLRDVIAAGEQLRITHALSLMFERNNKARLHNHYGPTETHAATAYTLPPSAMSWPLMPPIGRPISNNRIYVLGKDQRPVPLGVCGEICIAGAGVARGYLNRADLTAERFIADAFSGSGTRLYKSGDLGRYRADGILEYIGRKDQQVKIRGYRVELGEVAVALTNHKYIKDAVVVAAESDIYGKRLCAYVTTSGDIRPTPEGLRDYLAERLPRYMVPSAFQIVDTFPLSPNGKVNRLALANQDATWLRSENVAQPEGEIERMLADIWRSLLQVTFVGREDNFFDLGGHSLLAIQLVARIQQVLAREVVVSDVFAAPTVRELAKRVEIAKRRSIVPIVPVRRGGLLLPLSMAQQRLWFIEQLESANGAYHIPLAVRLKGELNGKALELALDAVVQRHESLRTVFRVAEGIPHQMVIPNANCHLRWTDLRNCTNVEREEFVKRHVTEETSERFDLATGPLIRGCVLRTHDDEHVLLVTMHHIVSDGWSIGILVREFAQLYTAFSEGRANPLPHLPVQYADYSVWQRTWARGDVLDSHLAHWRTVLEGANPLLGLPTDHPRPSTKTNRGRSVGVEFDPGFSTELKLFANKRGMTLFMVLCTGWAVLLSKLAGQEDVIVGTPVANRHLPEIEGLIGFFVNTLPIRITVSSEIRVDDLLAQVKDLTLQAFAHQEAPFEQIVDAVQPPRSLGYSPLFQVMFSLQNAPHHELSLPGITLIPQDLEITTSQFDVTLALRERNDAIGGFINYASDLFDHPTIEQWTDSFKLLLQKMVERVDAKVGELSIISKTVRDRLLANNAPGSAFPQDKRIHDLFEEQVDRTPDAVALVCDGKQITYSQLNWRANQLARCLIERGLQFGGIVGICLDRSIEYVVGIVGALKAGAAYLPLDASAPAARLTELLVDAGAQVLLVEGKYKNEWAARAPPSIKAVVAVDEDWSIVSAQKGGVGDWLYQTSTSRQLAYIIYTSGSTGIPKGVMVEHANVIRLFAATHAQFQFSDNDVWSLFHSFAFDFSAWEIWGALLYGGRLVIVSSAVARSPLLFYEMLCTEGVTVLNQTPTAFRLLSEAQERAPDLMRHCLRVVIFGGEALELQWLRPWVARNGIKSPRLVNMYGITETTIHVTYRHLQEYDIAAEWRGDVGRPITDVAVYVLDGNQEVVPIGVVGEIYVGGAGVARGYLKRPDLTADRFMADPFSKIAGSRMYRSGDLGRWRSNGSLEHVGRADDQIKVRGFRIEPGEIERALCLHEDVKHAVVVAREDVPAGKRLVAYLTVRATLPSAEELRKHLIDKLPEYMVPAAYVILEALPMTANGKLDSRALPAPTRGVFASPKYSAPRNEAERILCDIWASILGVAKVGIEDNFFSIGGDSILCIRVLTLARAAGVNFTVVDLFRNQTIAQLGEAIEGARLDVHHTGKVRAFELVSQGERDLLALDRRLEDAYPLSALQAGMYFHSEMDRKSAVYHDVFSYRIECAFDEDLFDRALKALLERHDILRTSFRSSADGRLLQVVYKSVDIAVQVEDLRQFDEVTQADLFRTWFEREKHQSFTWAVAPLMRIFIHLVCPNAFRYTLSFHHSILDGWSVACLQTELLRHYAGLLEGNEITMAIPRSRYRDFVAREQKALQSKSDREYWQRCVEDSEPSKGILFASNGRKGPSESKQRAIKFDPALCTRVDECIKTIGVPLRAALLAVHTKVMSLLGGQRDIVTGAVHHGRLDEEDSELVLGLFLNSVPVRMNLSDCTWKELVLRVNAVERSHWEHRHYPLAAIREKGAGTARFDTLFNFTKFHVYKQLEYVVGKPIVGAEYFEQTNFALVANFSQSLQGEDLSLLLTLDGSIFDDAQMDRIPCYYCDALRAMCEELDEPHFRRTYWNDQERHLLQRFNATQVGYPGGKLVHELFEKQVERTPDAVAVVFEGEQLSYAQLNVRANQLAQHLRERGIGSDQLVGIYLERGIEMMVALLGVLKAGGAYVPLDPQYPAERLRYVLEDALPPIVLTKEHLCDEFPVVSTQMILLDSDWADIGKHSGENLGSTVTGIRPGNLAYMIYTSGSTGHPKGVMVEHGGLLNYLRWAMSSYRSEQGEGSVVASSFAFDATVTGLYCPLLSGQKVVLVKEGEELDGVERLLRTEQRWSLVKISPAHLSALGRRWQSTVRCEVEAFVIGGEALAVETAALWRDLAPQTRLINEYGPTETVVGCIAYEIDEGWEERRGVPIGRPIWNTQIYILDGYLQPVPIGVVGEIYIGGAGVARGYLNRADLTAERFIADPFGASGGRLYKSGDLGRYRADGNIEYVGRNDFQVKIRGYRIELGEIESKLSSCEGVREAVVLAREDIPGEKRLVAYVTAQTGEPLVVSALRERLSAELPEYLVPAAYVQLSSLPLTLNGKLDRKALPAPDEEAYSHQRYEAPQGEIEELLAGIWQELLGVERVGRNDNFFELGGHSLLAVRLTSRLRKEFGVEVSLRDLFAQPTLQGVGRLMTSATRSAQTSIELADRSQPLPLSYAQQRLWFLNQLDQAASAAYHIPAALRLEGILDRAALRATLNTIVARHEALRTSFISIDGQPRQQIGPVDIGFQLTEHDLSALGGTDREARVKELSEAEAAGPFDLASGPLIRGQLLQLGAEEHVLLVTMHHIVSDGWSMGVLIREVGALYEALCAGREAALPKLPIQYADYAAWQRHWLQVEALQEQLKYWKEELSSAPALLELPTDRVRPVAQSFRAERIGFVMEEGLSTRLKAMCRQEEVTLFMLLLAGWSVLLSRLSGQPEVVIGVPVANRQRMELEGLIGFFVNTLALRVKVNSAQSIRDLLQQVKRQTLQGYAHQEAPFEQVVEVLQPARSLGHSAVFQVMLVLQNTPQQELSLQGLKLQPQEPPVGAVKFDLELSLQEVGEELYGSVNYASDLFERATIERWIGYFKSVLEEMTESEEREVAALALIGAAERDRILEEFNATHVEYPEGELVHELFEAQVERTPDAVAVVFEGEQLSYAQLNARANQLARYLVCAGVQPDDRVAICVERGFEMIVGLLGILKAGGAYVPLDPQYPAERLAYMLQDSAPVVLLTRESMRETFNAYSTVLVSLDKQWSEIAKLDQSNIAAAELGLNSKHLAYVIYTSGSTGHPKGVMVEHGGLLNYLRWAMSSYRSEQGEGSVVASSFAFDATVTGLYCPLLSGQKVVLVKEGEELDGVERLLRTEQRWSLVKISPAHLSALGRRWQSTVRCEVEAFVIGGEALAVETAALWRDLAPQTRLINEYGPTETVVGCIAYEIDEGWEERRGVPIGRPIWNTQIYILDGYLQPVPIGVVGEIYIGGAGVARGYLNRADLTAERFIADPFGASGGRLYKSGDLGRYRADGNIEYVGRNDFQVKIRGYRIELGEIESKLSSCEGVREAVVLAREDIPGEKRLVAYVTAQTGEPLVVSALRERLSAELPEYLVPAAYVQLSSLPLTLNGKLDRKALPAPDEEAYSHRRYEAPQGEIEELLAGIWQELLGVERVGRNDNFFELGGHSLLVMQVVSRMARLKHIEIQLRDVFECPILQSLAERVAAMKFTPQSVDMPLGHRAVPREHLAI